MTVGVQQVFRALSLRAEALAVMARADAPVPVVAIYQPEAGSVLRLDVASWRLEGCSVVVTTADGETWALPADKTAIAPAAKIRVDQPPQPPPDAPAPQP